MDERVCKAESHGKEQIKTRDCRKTSKANEIGGTRKTWKLEQ